MRRRTRPTPSSSPPASGTWAPRAGAPCNPPGSCLSNCRRCPAPRSSTRVLRAQVAPRPRFAPRAPRRTPAPSPLLVPDWSRTRAALHPPAPCVGAAPHRLDVGAGLLGDLVGAEAAVLIQDRDDLGAAGCHGLVPSTRPLHGPRVPL